MYDVLDKRILAILAIKELERDVALLSYVSGFEPSDIRDFYVDLILHLEGGF